MGSHVGGRRDSVVIRRTGKMSSPQLSIKEGQHRPMMREVAEELQRLARPVPPRTQGFHGVSALMMQGRSSDNSSGDYTSEESTDYYILQKKASMSIEFAR
ncbi:hypothetical protein SETIT_7G061700v2 [Setaria italica]|uniref:Uncharacterized protein n=2 Tax=Setaria italica TaxID=4555 RepID=A0A368RSF0_SETIT|nr:hypothetical protein SETIT_7G061700v2 [Setaria italica]